MNRRDLMKRIVGVSALVGAGARVSTVHAAANEQTPAIPALAVIECDGPISQETANRLKTGIEQGFADTPFRDLKVLVLGDGLRFTVLDAHGRILNERLQVEPVTEFGGEDWKRVDEALKKIERLEETTTIVTRYPSGSEKF